MLKSTVKDLEDHEKYLEPVGPGEEKQGNYSARPRRRCFDTIYGLPLVNQEQVDLFHQCTGLQTYPGHEFAEVTVICGAGSGKDSRIAATVALYEAFWGGHEKRLAPTAKSGSFR